jgi:hypothetical protein
MLMNRPSQLRNARRVGLAKIAFGLELLVGVGAFALLGSRLFEPPYGPMIGILGFGMLGTVAYAMYWSQR